MHCTKVRKAFYCVNLIMLAIRLFRETWWILRRWEATGCLTAGRPFHLLLAVAPRRQVIEQSDAELGKLGSPGSYSLNILMICHGFHCFAVFFFNNRNLHSFRISLDFVGPECRSTFPTLVAWQVEVGAAHPDSHQSSRGQLTPACSSALPTGEQPDRPKVANFTRL